ncbi:uncharacterized protein LOC118277335 [Spodoptera frugiperda]|uniref:Uncharacterized protein LOC118277335 n=1 Tax=Spodoptera frugiperda TaxID=7108 RepID=A0A9R0EQY3_SPOFR|nr:uncharacterized protein LOC118277335 [Spodoptera frugiperda]
MWLLSSFSLYISINIVTSNVDNLQHPIKPCHIGDVVENECNRCTCSSKTVFECKTLDCKKNSTHIDLDDIKQFCYPNQLYVQDLMTCICTKDGRWPHKSCSDTFQVLAPATIKTHKCTPDSYVRIDCNVCRCGPDGQIVNDRCTRNACEEDAFRRTSTKSNNIYSKCEVKNWYSLAPCQFCYCVNENKLICNTGSDYSKQLELGSYNLRICGTDLIREALELVPESQRPLRLSFSANTSTHPHKPRSVNTSTISVSKFKNVLKPKKGLKIERNEVKQESNETKTQFLTLGKESNSSSSSSSEEYYSDTEEQVVEKSTAAPVRSYKQSTVKPIKILLPPVMPKQTLLKLQYPAPEADEINSVRIDEDIDDDSSSSEDGVDIEVQSTPTISPSATISLPAALTLDVKTLQELAKGVKSAEYQYVGDTLNINLPRVLNKVFQVALRKSMVSLSSGTKCTPGETTTNGCNSCFCLKNSKLLCTNNICLREKRTK